MEWKITRVKGTCTACKAEFADDQLFYSALIDTGEEFTRRDLCEACWEANTEQIFSYWRTRIQESGGPKRTVVDDEVLLDFFQRLEAETETSKVNFRYLLGLMLMRKKLLKFHSIEREGDNEYLILRRSRSTTQHRVLDPRLTKDELGKLRDNLNEILFLET